MGRSAFDTNADGTNDFRALEQYGDEELKAYEVGYKGTLLDGALQLNLAVYYYDYDNYQTTTTVWESEGGNFSLPIQIGETVGRGRWTTPPTFPVRTIAGSRSTACIWSPIASRLAATTATPRASSMRHSRSSTRTTRATRARFSAAT